MSAEPELFSDGIRRRERERRRRGLAWSLASFAGHCAFFAAVVALTPVKDLVLPERGERANPAADLSADRIQDIAESLSEVRIGELLRQVQAMQAVLHNMDAMKEELAKDYDSFAERSAKNIRGELEALVAEAETDQRKASQAQESVKGEVAAIAAAETVERLAAKEASEDLRRRADRLREGSVEKANTAQADAVNALDRLQVKAEFAGFRKTASVAGNLRDAQMEAGRMQDAAQTDAVDTALALSDVANNTGVVERGRSELAAAREKFAAAERAKPEADRRIAAEESEKKAAEARRDGLRAEKRWEEAKAEQRAADAHRNAMESAKRDSRAAQHRINEANNAIRHWEQRLPGALKRQEELRRIAEERGGRRQVDRLERAAAAQSQVNAGIEALKAALESDGPELQKLSRGDAREENSLAVEDASQMTMTEAYGLARRLEAAITESYKDIKSAQTAIARRMSFDAAQKITDVARPERIEADAEAIESKPRTKEDLDRQKSAQRQVVDEAGSMAEASLAMMAEAMAIVMPDSGREALDASDSRSVRWMDEKDFEPRDATAVEERIAAMDAAAEYQVRIEQAAAEEAGMKAKDLSKLMAGRGEDAAAAESSGGPAQEGAPVPPPLKGGDAGLVPGNVVNVGGDGRGGIPAQWMYVNSWYVIGPFPNPNRVNLRRKFAPESVVDLDAVYAGKDGRTLRWRFCQAKNSAPPQPWMSDWRAEVVPEKGEEYAIYYAYAEVFFDRECDRWVAIGSDDRSDVWLNDVPIWGSSNRLKQWSLAEDFRRVHFRKGRNRLLVRVENGHWNLGWSVCIATGGGKGAL
ncbi:MAG: hypothetical protein IJI73_03945 [Kiritimatiellae bacterium]|nr:hypothetical protein [Kiritimatiellia bacterium]